MKRISESKIFTHIGFCIAAIAFSVFAIHFYIGDMRSNEAELGYTACFYFLICVYAGRWLAQTWLLKNKLVFFLLNAILAGIILTVLGGFVVQYRFHLHNRNFTDFLLKISPFFMLSIVLGIFLKLIRSTLQKQVKDAKATAAQRQSELYLLQSQLSPHFLFNTLNNMYGLSITEHEKIPSLLLKLSDLLRYSVYESRELFVPLKEELVYINNYIDFEKIRLGGRLILKTEMEDIPDPEIKIAPMLLIVFIENAFTHSRNTVAPAIHIDITLKKVDNFIVFSVKNSRGKTGKEKQKSGNKSGLGLANTIKRLELLYKGEYLLKQYEKGKIYSVDLRLKVK